MTRSNHQKMNRAIVAGCVVLTAIVTVTPAWSRCLTLARCEGGPRIPIVTPSPIPSPKASPTAPRSEERRVGKEC